MPTNVEGAQFGKATISKACRALHGDEKAVNLALESATRWLLKGLSMWSPEADVKFHIVVTIEKPNLNES